MKKEIRYYVTESGRIPFQNWIRKLNRRTHAVVIQYLERLARGASRKNIRSLGGIMSRRSESFDKYVAEQMKDLDFARESLLVSIEHFGETVEEALKNIIEQMGLKEFSELSGIPIQNVSAFVKGRRNLKQQTLDRYLSVFKLRSKLVVIQ